MSYEAMDITFVIEVCDCFRKDKSAFYNVYFICNKMLFTHIWYLCGYVIYDIKGKPFGAAVKRVAIWWLRDKVTWHTVKAWAHLLTIIINTTFINALYTEMTASVDNWFLYVLLPVWWR